jgi:hypothetical protein
MDIIAASRNYIDKIVTNKALRKGCLDTSAHFLLSLLLLLADSQAKLSF